MISLPPRCGKALPLGPANFAGPGKKVHRRAMTPFAPIDGSPCGKARTVCDNETKEQTTINLRCYTTILLTAGDCHSAISRPLERQDKGARVIIAAIADEKENNDNRACVAVLVIVRVHIHVAREMATDQYIFCCCVLNIMSSETKIDLMILHYIQLDDDNRQVKLNI